jgi:hypothetical protein
LEPGNHDQIVPSFARDEGGRRRSKEDVCLPVTFAYREGIFPGIRQNDLYLNPSASNRFKTRRFRDRRCKGIWCPWEVNCYGDISRWNEITRDGAGAGFGVAPNRRSTRRDEDE